MREWKAIIRRASNGYTLELDDGDEETGINLEVQERDENDPEECGRTFANLCYRLADHFAEYGNKHTNHKCVHICTCDKAMVRYWFSEDTDVIELGAANEKED